MTPLQEKFMNAIHAIDVRTARIEERIGQALELRPRVERLERTKYRWLGWATGVGAALSLLVAAFAWVEAHDSARQATAPDRSHSGSYSPARDKEEPKQP